MSNPLYHQINGGGMDDVARRFQQFKQNFGGDPKQAVMQMLQTGRINQAQLNQFQNMANRLSGILNKS